MKKISILLFLFVATNCFSQLYVSSNSSMYAKNEVLFVKQDVNLNATSSHIYLRNNAQLVQGTSSTSANTGLGFVSVYQEGTSNNFAYNYWCSPVGTSIAGNGLFGITMLHRPTDKTTSTQAVVLPSTNYDGQANPLSIAPYWIRTLVNEAGYSGWVLVSGETSITAGQGFSMKGTAGTDSTDPENSAAVNNPGSAQRYDFRGKPNDGNISISLGTGQKFTLTGNPYPSALHLNSFLLDTDNLGPTGGIAYFWEQDSNSASHYLADYRGGYGTYAPVNLTTNGIYTPATFNSYNSDGSLNTTGTTGNAYGRRYAPIGQGFMLYSETGGTATFRNTYRTFVKENGSTSQFNKYSSEEIPNLESQEDTDEENDEVSHFKLNTIINNQFTRQLALAFIPEATDGIDPGIDAGNMNGGLPSDVTFWLENETYVIQGIAFDVTKTVPLHVKATEASTFKFYIPEIINFDSNQPIYILDNADGSYHDIKNDFYLINVPAGMYTDRFEITFTNQTLSTPTNLATQFIIYQDNGSSTLRASNPNSIGMQSFNLYDISGRVIVAKSDLNTDSEYGFSTAGLSLGIYIAEFITASGEKLSEKVLISNLKHK
ncbi:T9SS type A sorting domain-containing protein [Flavobacterium sp. SM2513]|uniref:T9SS type A sorting domain-containing protein n=1 Tax=Flavobacterium sp. SM2513 TaxID=3424766 RepID=UPI003D7FEE48